jgi:hypothetical protein
MISRKPEFLITGAAKSGTSSLARHLSLHPRLYLPKQEVHFFSKYWDRGTDWYLQHFPHTDRMQGEKSPTYLYNLECHSKMYDMLPDAKLIIILRDPVARAYSNWNMRYNEKRLIPEGLNFNREYGNELKSLDFDKMLTYYLDNFGTEKVCEKPLDIFHRGLYILQIESLLRFYSRKQLLILITEHFFENEEKGFDTIYRFLNIESCTSIPYQKTRVGHYKKEIPKADYEKLKAFYRPYNQKLYKLLGFRINSWED